MTLKDEVRHFAEGLWERDVPVMVVYQDDGHWRLYGRQIWKEYAAALRSLADQCDRMADGQRLN